MFELFDHTADLGIRVRGADLKELLEEAARALFSVLVVDLGTVRPVDRVALRIEGTEPEDLFLDWLDELLYRFETEHLLLVRFEVQPDERGLTATAWGETYDPARHELDQDVKAITYHQLKVERDADGWTAEVIVDI
jgi:SHS2 domain-containing protein